MTFAVLAARDDGWLASQPDKLSFAKDGKRIEQNWDQGLERFEPIGRSSKDDNGHGKRRQVLLELDVLIGREDDIEFRGRFHKKSSVCKAGPAHLSNSSDLMTDQEMGESPRKGFIQ